MRLLSFKFLPAGRINAGAGTGDRNVDLVQLLCYGELLRTAWVAFMMA